MKSTLDSVCVTFHHCHQRFSFVLVMGKPWSGLLSNSNRLLRGKLRHIKNFKTLFEQKSISTWMAPNRKWLEHSAQQELGPDLQGKGAEAKIGNY